MLASLPNFLNSATLPCSAQMFSSSRFPAPSADVAVSLPNDVGELSDELVMRWTENVHTREAAWTEAPLQV